MDLGIKDRKAIICASSKGLGKACAKSLLEEGVSVVINARGEEALQETFKELSLIDKKKVSMVVADLNTDEGRKKLIESCPEADILVNNNSGPPPVNFLETDKEDWIKALDANMLSAIFMIKDLLPGMIERNFGRIINITSAMVKSPHPLMSLSTSARTGLTAFSKGISKDVAKHNITINNMLPERFDTDRQIFMTEMLMKNQGISREEARTQITSSIAANRFGRPDEFGATCAFLCSEHAGFISGQNLQMDGGSYEGLI
ncbi:MAG: 3-oxoacyl-ACP reductase [Flavobacteriaceae bacterium]|nr:3-oxoacyl-ACP reductase [Flavobacteriaceae bacterium]|tara:strand:- start:1450 stop:2229 length:780 start_codon:yes stop_codon:yes gene_type:complete